jgi:hypothetical protein
MLRFFKFVFRTGLKSVFKKTKLPCSNSNTTLSIIPIQIIKDKMPKGCGGGSDVCRFLAAYGTATKAGQKLHNASKDKSP